MILNVDKLSFAYGTDDIFKDASLQIREKERVGLVGPNGAGKSTFIRLITGQLEPDSGTIIVDPHTRIGHLEQEIDFDQSKTLSELFDEIFRDYRQKEERLRELEEQISITPPEKLDKLYREYDRLQEFIRNENIYSAESRVRGMIKGLQLAEEDLQKPFNTLSGGQKTRVILAMLLLRSPELLILDEPTNFLDIETLNWLENTLHNYPGSILLISHDRYFLNRICTRIVEVDETTLKNYPGDFDEYVEKKEIQRAEQNRLYALTLREVQRQQKIIQRYRNINSKQSSKHAASREKALARIEIPNKVKSQHDVLFYFTPKFRSGEEVLRVENLKKDFDDKNIFHNISFLINRTDKIGIIGENGIGKTTLFNILRKKIKADGGRFDYGAKVNVAFFDQESNDLREYEDFNLIDVIRESNIEMDDGEIRNFLANFLFTGDDVFKQVKDLSGGEKVRIKLAQLMLSKANFLIMDEPTNHIDMATKEILENVLINYQGTLLFISHDRYFLNRVANKIYEFTANGINEYLGNYDDYLNKKETDELINKEPEKVVNKTQRAKQRKKEKLFKQTKIKLQDRIRETEKAIEEHETTIADFEALMGNPDFYKTEDHVQVLEDYNRHKEELNRLTDEWEEASIELEELLDE